MSREDRLQKMQRIFRGRRSVSRAQLIAELGIKRATVTRYLAYLKDTFGVPVRYDSSTRTYSVDAKQDGSDVGLLGLWFSAAELHALLTMDQLIKRMEPGILRSHIEPLKGRLRKILGTAAHSLDEIEKRVRVLPMAARRVDAKVFQAILTALLNRRRLTLEYVSRGDGAHSNRIVSPQRLVHYRDNWYLDAWCHKKRGLRMFSVDAIDSTKILDAVARDMPEEYLSAVLESGYGIFSGRKTKIARIRFSPVSARWVASEEWHPKQKGAWDKKGNYILKFSYSNHPELVMDLLRYIPEVDVLGPKSLRNYLNQRIKAANAKLV